MTCIRRCCRISVRVFMLPRFCLPLYVSALVCMCPPLFVCVRPCLYVSVFVCTCPPLFACSRSCLYVSALVCMCPPLFVCVRPCLYVSALVCMSLPLSVCSRPCLYVSALVCMCPPLLPSLHLCFFLAGWRERICCVQPWNGRPSNRRSVYKGQRRRLSRGSVHEAGSELDHTNRRSRHSS